MKKGVLYMRASSKEITGRQTASLPAQKDKLLAYCNLHDIEVIGVFTDRGTGTTRQRRKGLEQAMAKVCENQAILISYSLSRISRSVRDCLNIFEEVKACKGDLACVVESIDTSTSHGRFIFTLTSALAELELATLKERTIGSLATLRAKGKKTGGKVPFGWKVGKDNKLIPIASEQKALKFIKDEKVKGVGYTAIARGLEAKGIKTKTGKSKWQDRTVKSILENKINTEKGV